MHCIKPLLALTEFYIDSDESQLLKDIHRDINDQLKQLKTAKDRGKRQHIRREIKTFRKELYERY